MRAAALAIALPITLAALVLGTAEAPHASSCGGTPGRDTLHGTPRADVLCGLAGNDSITGLEGNDRIDGGPGNDVIDGGPGNDRIVGGPGTDFIAGGLGDDVVNSRDGAYDRVDCAKGVDVVYADSQDKVSSFSCETVKRG
jgi:Ca2+-binding RTX toxin-like protein